MTRDSGTLGYPGEEECALNGDHLGIVKYSSQDDNNFLVVSAALGRMVQRVTVEEKAEEESI